MGPLDCSLPGSSVHGILQARILEWIAISFSMGSSWPRDRTEVSGTEPRSSALQEDTLPSEPPGKLLHLWVEIKKKKEKKSLWYIYWLLESFLLTSNALGYISLQKWISDPKNDFFSDTELHLVKAW